MQSDNYVFIEYLKEHGHNVTKPRIEIYEALSKGQPLSINQLCKDLPNIERSSIYRTLGLFEKINIAQRLQIGWKHKFELSDKFSHHHHHMTCSKCGAVIEISDLATIEKALKETAKLHLFTTTNHIIEIQGLCNYCSSSN